MAIGKTESGGNYKAIGPATRNGDRAVGKYQVMSNNVPKWTKEVLGVAMSPKEFLNNPRAQDAVAIAKLQNYYDTHGSHADAASMWFSGKPYKGNTRNDQYINVPEYVRRTAKNFNEVS
jgi:hypothetical protein